MLERVGPAGLSVYGKTGQSLEEDYLSRGGWSKGERGTDGPSTVRVMRRLPWRVDPQEFSGSQRRY